LRLPYVHAFDFALLPSRVGFRILPGARFEPRARSSGSKQTTIEIVEGLAPFDFNKEAVMPGLKTLALTLTLSALTLAGCAKDYRQIFVVNDGKAELVTYGKGPSKEPKIWAPGRILAFRTDSAVPEAPGTVTGKAGHVYRVSDGMALEEIAVFQPTVPNDSLAYTYGK
jgi:hypothetical protein